MWLDALYCEFILWEDCNLLIDSMCCVYANNSLTVICTNCRCVISSAAI